MEGKSSQRNALIFIVITMVIDSVGIGLIVPVMPALLKELLNLSADEAAPWGGYLSFAYAAMNFLFGPTIGNLSDRFGRRPVLLLALGALVVDYLIMGFAASISVLFLGRLLAGICGATFSTAQAYIADVTVPEKRAQAFGLVGAAFGIGFILGPGIGGLLGGITPRAPFFAAAALALVNMAYGFFVLPESLTADRRRSFEWRRANPLGALAYLSDLPNVLWLIAAMLLFSFAHVVYPGTWNFHADARYGWDTSHIGWSLMAFGIASSLVQGLIIRVVLRWLQPTRTVVLGLVLNVIAYSGFAMATQGWMVYAWLPFAALGAMTGPALNSLMSTRVPSSSQGELQGALASVQGVTHMFGPIVMTQVFSFFLSDAAPVRFYGAAFALAACLTVLAALPFRLGMRAQGSPADSRRGIN
ncbi:MAG: TCR/Tet family MFS transporter [Planctomycetales bacterium]|nr:TCR/Tet family MFS transporter [Planctomycetales bacterium]